MNIFCIFFQTYENITGSTFRHKGSKEKFGLNDINFSHDAVHIKVVATSLPVIKVFKITLHRWQSHHMEFTNRQP